MRGKNQDHNRGIAVASSGVTVAGLSGIYLYHPIAQRLSDTLGGIELPNGNGFRHPFSQYWIIRLLASRQKGLKLQS